MKSIILLFLLSLLMHSCSQNTKVKELEVQPRDNIKNVLDSFIRVSNDKELVYELYVDRIKPDIYYLYLYAGRESLSKNNPSITSTIISGIKINIYSGFEHYFKTRTDTLSFDDSFNDLVSRGISWIVTDSCGVLSIYEETWLHPYHNLPMILGEKNINFIPPVLRSNN